MAGKNNRVAEKVMSLILTCAMLLPTFPVSAAPEADTPQPINPPASGTSDQGMDQDVQAGAEDIPDDTNGKDGTGAGQDADLSISSDAGDPLDGAVPQVPADGLKDTEDSFTQTPPEEESAPPSDIQGEDPKDLNGGSGDINDSGSPAAFPGSGDGDAPEEGAPQAPADNATIGDSSLYALSGDTLTITQDMVTAAGGSFVEAVNSALQGSGMTGDWFDVKKLIVQDGVVAEGEVDGTFPKGILEKFTGLEVLDLRDAGNTALRFSITLGNTHSHLKEVYLPATLKKLDDYAFHNCAGLKTVAFPNGCSLEEIGESAFQSSGLESFTIPDTVKTIGKNVFLRCSKLQSVTLPSGLTEIPEGLFNYCSSLTLPALPDTVTSIGRFAFADCSSLGPMPLPKNLETISESAFAGAGLSGTLVLPDSLKTIGQGAFWKTGVEKVIGPSGSNLTGLRDAAFGVCNQLTTVDFSNAVGMEELAVRAFENCADLYSVKLPPNLKTVNEMAFQGCISLASIEIPDTVTEIANSAFLSNKMLASCKMSENIGTIGDYAFSGCELLTDIDLHNVGYINSHAFEGCGFTDITLPPSLIFISEYAFKDCSQLRCLVVSNNHAHTAPGIFAGTYFTTSPQDSALVVNQPNVDNQSWLSYAFYYLGRERLDPGDHSLTEEQSTIILGELQRKSGNMTAGMQDIPPETSVYLEISKSAMLNTTFEGAIRSAMLDKGRASDVLPNVSGLRLLDPIEAGFSFLNQRDASGNYIFSSLQSLDLTNATNTEIPANAFLDHPALKSVKLGASIASIGEKAFSGCASLEDVTLKSAANVGKEAFSGCAAFKKLTIMGTSADVGTWDIDAFTGTPFATATNTTRLVIEKAADYADWEKAAKKVFPTADGRKPVNYRQVGAYSLAGGVETLLPYVYDGTLVVELTEPKGGLQVAVQAMLAADGFDSTEFKTVYDATTTLKITGGAVTDDDTYFIQTNFNNLKVLDMWESNAYGSMWYSWTEDQYGVFPLQTFTSSSSPIASSLEKIALPAKVKRIGTKAFRGLLNVKELVINEYCLKNIATMVFENTTVPNKITLRLTDSTKALDDITYADWLGCIKQEDFWNISNLASTQAVVEQGSNSRTLTKSGFDSGVLTVKAADTADATGAEIKFDAACNQILKQYNMNPTNEHSKITKVVVQGGAVIGTEGFAFLRDLSVNKSLKELDMSGAGDTEIPDEALSVYGKTSKLESIQWPANVKTIGMRAFEGCVKLDELVLPASVESIREYAFSLCNNLTKITTESASSLASISGGAFQGDGSGTDKLVQVDLSSASGLTVIGYDAFSGRPNLADVKLPQSVQTVGDRAFMGSSVTEMDLSNVKGVGAQAFFECAQLGSLTAQKGATWGERCLVGTLYATNPSTAKLVLNDADATQSDWVAFAREVFTQQTLTSARLSVPQQVMDAITKTGRYKMSGGTMVAITGAGIATELVINTSNMTAGTDFETAAEFEMLSLGVTYSNIETIVADGVLADFAYIASHFPNLKTLNAKTALNTTVEDYTFNGIMNNSDGTKKLASDKLATIILPDALTSIGTSVFSNNPALETAVLPQGLERIGMKAFYNCIALTKISSDTGGATLPSGLQFIDSSAFSICTALGTGLDLELPASVTHIGWSAFSRTSYKSLRVQSGSALATVDGYAFANNPNMTQVDLGNATQLMQLGEGYTFSGCTALESVVLPKNLREVPDKCFNQCGEITQVRFLGDTDVCANGFAQSNKLETLILPSRSSAVWAQESLSATQFRNTSYVGFENTRLVLDDPNATNEDWVYTAEHILTDKALNSSGDVSDRTADRAKVLRCKLDGDGNIAAIPPLAIESALTVTDEDLPAFASQLPNMDMLCASIANKLMPYGNIGQLMPQITSFTLKGLPFDPNIIKWWMPNVETLDLSESFYSSLSGSKELTALKEVRISGGVVTIENGSFKDCPSLSTVTLPLINRLNTVGSDAFANTPMNTNPSKSRLIIEAGSRAVSYDAAAAIAQKLFPASYSQLRLYKRDGENRLTRLYPTAFKLEITRAKAGAAGSVAAAIVKELEAGAGSAEQQELDDLRGTIVEASMSEVLLDADACKELAKMQNLETLVFSDGASFLDGKVPDNAFAKLEKLHFTLPSDVTEIGAHAFEGCKAMEPGTLAGVVTLGEAAFAGAKAPQNLELPLSLKNIGADAFKGCGVTQLRIPYQASGTAEGAKIVDGALAALAIDFTGDTKDFNAIRYRDWIGSSAYALVTLGGNAAQIVAKDGAQRAITPDRPNAPGIVFDGGSELQPVYASGAHTFTFTRAYDDEVIEYKREDGLLRLLFGSWTEISGDSLDVTLEDGTKSKFVFRVRDAYYNGYSEETSAVIAVNNDIYNNQLPAPSFTVDDAPVKALYPSGTHTLKAATTAAGGFVEYRKKSLLGGAWAALDAAGTPIVIADGETLTVELRSATTLKADTYSSVVEVTLYAHDAMFRDPVNAPVVRVDAAEPALLYHSGNHDIQAQNVYEQEYTEYRVQGQEGWSPMANGAVTVYLPDKTTAVYELRAGNPLKPGEYSGTVRVALKADDALLNGDYPAPIITVDGVEPKPLYAHGDHLIEASAQVEGGFVEYREKKLLPQAWNPVGTGVRVMLADPSETEFEFRVGSTLVENVYGGRSTLKISVDSEKFASVPETPQALVDGVPLFEVYAAGPHILSAKVQQPDLQIEYRYDLDTEWSALQAQGLALELMDKTDVVIHLRARSLLNPQLSSEEGTAVLHVDDESANTLCPPPQPAIDGSAPGALYASGEHRLSAETASGLYAQWRFENGQYERIGDGGALLEIADRTDTPLLLRSVDGAGRCSAQVRVNLHADDWMYGYDAIIRRMYRELDTPEKLWDAAQDYPVTENGITVEGLLPLYHDVLADVRLDAGLAQDARKMLDTMAGKEGGYFEEKAKAAKLSDDPKQRAEILRLGEMEPALDEVPNVTQESRRRAAALYKSLKKIVEFEGVVEKDLSEYKSFSAEDTSTAVRVAVDYEKMESEEQKAVEEEPMDMLSGAVTRVFNKALYDSYKKMDKDKSGSLANDVVTGDREKLLKLKENKDFEQLKDSGIPYASTDGQTMKNMISSVTKGLDDALQMVQRLEEMKTQIDALPKPEEITLSAAG